MTAANTVAVVINIRLQDCAMNTGEACIGSQMKILIKCFVKNLFPLLGGDFPPLLFPLYCFHTTSFPCLDLELWSSPCARGDCWGQSPNEPHRRLPHSQIHARCSFSLHFSFFSFRGPLRTGGEAGVTAAVKRHLPHTQRGMS